MSASSATYFISASSDNWKTSVSNRGGGIVSEEIVVLHQEGSENKMFSFIN